MRIDRTIRSNEQHHFIFRGFSCHACLVTHFIEQELLHYNAFIGRTAISIGYLPHQCKNSPIVQPQIFPYLRTICQ